MEAFLQLLADGKVDVAPLITHRFPIEQAPSAYDLITGKTQEIFLGVLITYPDIAEQNFAELKFAVQSQRVESVLGAASAAPNSVTIGLLGAGSFAVSTLLPAMKRINGVKLVGVCSATGTHSHHAASKFGFDYSAADEDKIVNDAAINTVVIATRHHLHAGQVIAALRAGKHVFCEKPLCLNESELSEIARAHESHGDVAHGGAAHEREEHVNDARASARKLLMVGFNRRFAPLALRFKSFVREIHEPLALHYRVNAGFIPADHWLNDPQQGGGRIIGEVCHFVDLLCFLVGAAPVEVQAHSLANPGKYSNDNVVSQIRFADGSQGTISYLANGDKAYSKERLEVFGGGRVAVLEDFRRLELVAQGRKQVFRSLLSQDKGHRSEWQAFVDAIRNGGTSPIPFSEIVATMLATFALEESRALGQPVAVKERKNFKSADSS